jgi:hypothetical protein
VNLGQVFAVGAALVRRQGVLIVGVGVGPMGADGAGGAFDFGITGFDLAGVKVKQFQRLLEDKEVLLAPGAGEGAGDLCFALLTVWMTQGGQLVRVALSGDDGADDAQAGVAGGVGDRLVEADVHMDQRLLHTCPGVQVPACAGWAESDARSVERDGAAASAGQSGRRRGGRIR